MELALVGNPNVGKSVLFNRITGVGVIFSNYPGTTVEILKGKVKSADQTIEVMDLPGIYSLSGSTKDEEISLELLAESKPSAVIAVVDATRLEQGLVLVFQLIEMGFPVVVALNFMDLANKRFEIDVEKLSEILDVPVVPTVAVTGEGVDKLCSEAFSGQVTPSDFSVSYDSHIEAILDGLTSVEDIELDFPIKGSLLKLLEDNEFFTNKISPEVRKRADELKEEFEEAHGETIDVHIARDRYGEAGKVASECLLELESEETLKERISSLTLSPGFGLPLLALVLIGIFLSVVYIGGLLEESILEAYGLLVGDFFEGLASFIGGQPGEAIAIGIDLSIQAILAIVIPYILVFYLILGVLEDSGYLPRVVVMLDGLMHKIGLHGRAIIPMIVGLGCNVPAILATRTIESRRERLILATITIITIPCSAQTVVIIGTVGNYSGVQWAALIYVILFAMVIILGRLLHKYMKFEPSSLAIEVPDLTYPQASNVLYKTGVRVKEFFLIAFPILLVGSIFLEFTMVYDVLNMIVQPLSPFTVGLLGLPAITIIALIFGVLRKEMALQLLVVLFGSTNLALFLSPSQLFVFAIVMATYMPCLAAFAVLKTEFGWKDTVKITVSSVTIAFLLGGLFHLLFSVA